MKFSRRDLIHAGCTIAGATLAPHFMDQAEAALRLHGSAQVVTPSGLSLRNVINLNGFSFITNDYAMIDHVRSGTKMVGPYSSSFDTTTDTWPNLLDANGWPNTTVPAGNNFGGGFQIPDPTNFGSAAGSYTIDWEGNGNVLLCLAPAGASNSTWATQNLSNCSVSFQLNGSNGQIQFTSTGGASKASAQFSVSSTQTGPQTMVLRGGTTGTGGFFVKNIRVYRTADKTDLDAGLVFRRGWKQPLVNLDPSAIRFMNILGGNSDLNIRFENRTLPNNAGYCGNTQWLISPNYKDNAAGINQYTVTAATPTTGNPKTTPTSMVHGEVATLRHTNGFTRSQGGVGVTAVTNANPGVVTTSIPHGYNTGDKIAHYVYDINNVSGTLQSSITVINCSSGISAVANGMFVFGPGIQAGTKVVSVVGTTLTLSLAATISKGVGLSFRAMNNLHLFPCTITVVDSTHYSLGVDTTSWGTFSTAGTGTTSYQFISLQVGSGSDRTPYACTFDDGGTPAAFFGQYLRDNDYKTWYFDKTVSAETDGSGNPKMGVWMYATTPNDNTIGASGDFPIEICTALVNELNAMSPAHTIGMWMNIPTMGLCSMDPDYTSASNWAVNAVDVVKNPNSTVRASGFSALGYSGATKLNDPLLVLEYSNELWPSGTNDGRAYLINRGTFRWPTIRPYQNWQDLKALRSTCWTRDVKASNPPGLSNIKFVIGLWGSQGLSPGSGSGNYETVFGGSVTANPAVVGDWYTNDTLVTGGSWARPIDNHDGVCFATYFDANGLYYDTVTGTGTFIDDAAKYHGADNSGVLSFSGSVDDGAGGAGFVLTVTGSVTNGPLVKGQVLNATGLEPNTTILGQLSGTAGAAGTYSISAFDHTSGGVTVSQKPQLLTSRTMTSPANSGGNYTGAANPTAALNNYVSHVVDAGNVFGEESTTRYATVIIPQISAALPAGKVGLCYEGGPNWQVVTSIISGSVNRMTAACSMFAFALTNSSQWATAQTDFFNNYSAISKCFMPSIYIWIGDRWAYANPDTYALSGGVPTEGQALLNNPPWVAMGNRNQALPS